MPNVINDLAQSNGLNLSGAGGGGPPLLSPLQTQAAAQLISGIYSANGNGMASIDRKLFPLQQLAANAQLDSMIRQRTGLLGRGNVAGGLIGPEQEQLLNSQGWIQNAMINNPLYWSMVSNDLINGLGLAAQSRAASTGNISKASELSASVASLLDPNSKPFAPRFLAETDRSGIKSAEEFSFKPEVTFERDSNSNVVRRSDLDFESESKIRKIWEAKEVRINPQGSNAQKVSCLGPIGSKKTASNSGDHSSDSDDESALKKKHQSGRFRRESSTSAESSDDQLGMRMMVKALQAYPEKVIKTLQSNNEKIDPDFEEEKKFIDMLEAQNPKQMLHPRIGSYLKQQDHVVTPLFDPCHECPEEYLEITTRLLKSLGLEGGPQTMVDWPTDMLFFYFYMAPNDAMQLMAGHYLNRRGWRYSKSRHIWVARKKDTMPEFRTDIAEGGYYQFFNVNTWRREVKYFTLSYEDLADRTPLEAILTQLAARNPSAAAAVAALAGKGTSEADLDTILMSLLKYPTGQKFNNAHLD